MAVPPRIAKADRTAAEEVRRTAPEFCFAGAVRSADAGLLSPVDDPESAPPRFVE